MEDSSDRLLRAAWHATRLRRAFQPADPSQRLDLGAVNSAWRALGAAAAEKLRAGRGTVLPRLGSFVLLHSGPAGQPDEGPCTPSLQLSREFVRSTGLVPAVPEAPPRAVASTSSAVSFASLSRQCGLPKDTVQALVKEVSRALGTAVAEEGSGGGDVWLSLPPLGSLHCTGGKAEFVFSREFCESAALRQPAPRRGQRSPPPSSLRAPSVAVGLGDGAPAGGTGRQLARDTAAAAASRQVDRTFRESRKSPRERPGRASHAKQPPASLAVSSDPPPPPARERDGSSDSSGGSGAPPALGQRGLPDEAFAFEPKQPPPRQVKRQQRAAAAKAARQAAQQNRRTPATLQADDRAVAAGQRRAAPPAAAAAAAAAVSSREESSYTAAGGGAGGGSRQRRGGGALTVEQVGMVRRLCRLLDVFCALDGSGRGYLKEFDLTTGLPSALGE
jgi:hypothetical protein